MNVDRFLDELEFLLSDLPQEEREEALDFYRCYFEDAGVENEAAIIEELGSPEKLAYSIREGLKEKEDEGEYTETGYRTFDDISAPATKDAHAEEKKQSEEDVKAYKHISVEEQYKQKYAKKNKRAEQKASYKAPEPEVAKAKRDSKVPAPLRVFGGILMGIVKVLMVIAAICIVILLIAALVALIVAVCASGGVTAGCLLVGIGLLVTGSGLVGVAMIGLAFLSFAIFLLILIGLVAFCKKGLAGGMRGITSVTGRVVRGDRKKEA